jgi:hypothetical protein
MGASCEAQTCIGKRDSFPKVQGLHFRRGREMSLEDKTRQMPPKTQPQVIFCAKSCQLASALRETNPTTLRRASY